MAKKVLVFADIGIDDIAALMYGYRNENIDIVGVVTEYGNIPRENAIASVQYLKTEVFPTTEALDTVVIAGAENPMTAEPVAYFPEIHGEFGLGPITPPHDGSTFELENFSMAMDIIKKHKNELTIVNIGRLTSLATLFLLYPKTMKEINQVYIMGGAFWVPGNVTAVSEANFHGDPVAAQIVLTYCENATIVPLNVTERAIVTPEMVNYIDQEGHSKIFKPMVDYYYNFYKKRNPNVQGSPLHDVLTLMAVDVENLLSYRNYPVHIVQATTGTERGQSIADIRSFGGLEEEEKQNLKKHRIAFDLNYQAFFKNFMTIMSGKIFS